MRVRFPLHLCAAAITALALITSSGKASAQTAWSPSASSASTPAPNGFTPHCPPSTLPCPPTVLPAEESALRARAQADARAKLVVEMPAFQAQAARNVQEERRRAWIERGRLLPPSATPMKWPLIGGGVSERIGMLGGRPVTFRGPEATFRVQPLPDVAFEANASYVITSYPHRTFESVAVESHLLVALWTGPGSKIYARGGAGFLFPTSGRGRTPDRFFRADIGFAFDVAVAPLGDGGHAAIAFSFDALLQGGFGGEDAAMRKVRLGIEAGFGPCLLF